jgi:predicted transposase YbfD/YdcC
MPASTALSLRVAFAQVPDPRRAASVTYPLPAMLGLAVSAMLCAHTSVLAMAEWAARQPAALLEQLGFPAGRIPRQSTVHRLLAKLDATAVAAALQACFDPSTARERGEEGVAIDGKAQRGRRQYEANASTVQVLTAFCAEQHSILVEHPVEQQAETQEAELTVATRLIDQVDWQGRVLTGDALYCQRDLCQQVCTRGGDYLLTVKTNQPHLYRTLMRVFDPQARPLLDRRRAAALEKGHGRIDHRILVATADPLALPDWPHIAQVFRLERTWREHGRQHQQVRYGITSLPPAIDTPQRLLALKRGHWLIENQGHRAKDVSFGDDACLIHVGQGPAVCGLLRGAAITLLHRAGFHAIASRLRYHAQHPAAAVALLDQPLPSRA